MEEEIGVKVTRLRRRLSVEAEDVKSPSTQSTPTKKRGGRLAAKPQLELIDENASEIEKPKRTRKPTIRDAEPEEKAVTPSRRSTRIRSNTSIVSETPLETEDKGTPSRRITRIKSNTSIVADTTQHVDSPRAKRAARRTSQVGSDNEAPVTPGRTTRRTRKDSTSSVDKQGDPNLEKLGPQVKEVIVEETENNIKDLTNKDTPAKERNESPTTRKSPRLIEKTGKRSSLDLENKYELESVKESNGVKSDSADASIVSSLDTPKINKSHEEINLSISSSNLIKQLDDEVKTGNAYLNKTASALEESQKKSKRRRTKSWTTSPLNSSNNDNFLSDTEATIKKNKANSNTANVSSYREGVINTSTKSIKKTEEQCDIKDNSLNSSIKSEKKKKKRHDNSILDNETRAPIANTLADLNKSDANDKDLPSQTDDPNFTERFFREAPSGPVESLVYIEDSDSNAGAAEKGSVLQNIESGDQCVPVVENQLEDDISKEKKNNCSYEPMDIDETMPENVSLSVFTDKNASEIKAPNLLKRKSLQNISVTDNINIDHNHKSRRKSNISDLESDNETTQNKSMKKALTAASACTDPTDMLINKSKRKSINNCTEEVDEKLEDNSSNPDCNSTLNKSKRKSSISNFATSDDIGNNSLSSSSYDDSGNKSTTKVQRKSAIMNSSIDKNKSKRKSLLSYVAGEDNSEIKRNHDGSFDLDDIHKDNNDTMGSTDSKSIPSTNVNASIPKLDVSNKNESVINESYNKPKKGSIALEATHDKSTRKSSLNTVTDNDELDSGFNKSNNYDDNSNLGSNKSKRKSSNTSDSNVGNNFNKYQKGSSDLINSSSDKLNNKSKRKSSISKTDVDDSIDSALNKSCNKSKRKSSILNMESQIFEKSNNENKSTLVLSQIKDVSETNVTKELYELNESRNCNEQLSQSANVPNVIKDKENNKKNLSLTYSTSTPLQQKPVKKIGMQINSSIITPNTTKIKNNSALNGSKKDTSDISQNDASELSDGESEGSSEDDNEASSEEESIHKSKLIEDEAEEASNDYESGDSRDQDAREYEEQHEIVEKGVTLDSEDEDFSDDSEYEKDSFVVDSEEEDGELLSGSGDDLSMSADELSMSAKSKRKFNDRKIKEQKKASREMFEARHKLNKSDNKTNSNKKLNRQRLESSESESDIKICNKPKKNKRARIDSSQDITITQSDHDTSEFKQNKKASRRLSDSVCEENATNESEISIHGNNETDKDDPLSLHGIIKEEPKTPQKDSNISTVSIANVEIEAVDIQNNISILKSNQTTDPLQTTSATDCVDVSEESISENEEITENYNSVLNYLNVKSIKVKSLDMPFNLDKKAKRKDKEPIIDQLNLTQTKNLKSRKLNSDLKDKKIMEKVNKSINTQEEGSSDSIDMKLLFNDDSTDSEVKVSSEKENKASVEEFIPLKRALGKTNILEKTDSTCGAATIPNESSDLNLSKSKKVKHTVPLPEKTEEVENVVTEEDISKKRKRKPTNESIEETTEIDNAGAPEGPNKSFKTINQKKKRKISHTINNENVEEKVPDAVIEKKELLPVSKSKKKSKTAAVQNPVQDSHDSTKKSKKRKERDDDEGEKSSKVIKQNSLDKVHVPRLSTNVLKQLDDNPRKFETMDNIISTTSFKVEETKKRRNKPSNYLEQSVYLNDSREEQRKNKTVKAPKVLPFIPTASTSDYGFTTNFKVNVIPQETQFVAQSSDVYNFKQDYLQKNRIKKLGTFEKYKRHRTIKLSKF
ncbi:unnamed protein product [Arctia plantaginis]|uniref:Protein slender lobes n=1 Tax=Arctia plantaginis TaxID=874455 RepID=A0A8S1AEI0_ARCPL|nr:unnamed protein product [Arctia plantaginis]